VTLERWLSTVVFACALSGCWSGVHGSGDFTVAQPAGYALVRANPVDITIERPDRVVVITQTIDGYAVRGHLVVGQTTAPSERREAYRDVPTGYFVLDTHRGFHRQGMSKEQWLQLLRANDVATEPALSRPSPIPS
jgi:hypothetical protein